MDRTCYMLVIAMDQNCDDLIRVWDAVCFQLQIIFSYMFLHFIYTLT